MFKLECSELAKNFLHQWIKNDGEFIRVGVAGGSCSGFSYVIKVDQSFKPDDIVFEKDDLRIVVDKKSIIYLNGTIIDLEGDALGKEIVFKNPNITSQCGCGKSFSV